MKLGSIFAPEAYAHGRMLNNGAWLEYGCCGMDVDLVFNNRAVHASLKCELGRTTIDWNGVNQAQRWFYEDEVWNGPHVAVHLHHEVDPRDGLAIDTLNDIMSFQLMAHDKRCGVVLSPVVHDVDKWRRLVLSWTRNAMYPALLRERVLAHRDAKVIPLVR